jgi:hypothetical protein
MKRTQTCCSCVQAAAIYLVLTKNALATTAPALVAGIPTAWGVVWLWTVAAFASGVVAASDGQAGGLLALALDSGYAST